MNGSNPPTNYNVTTNNGQKVLNYIIDADVINTRIKILDVNNILFDGTSLTNSIVVPNSITGFNKVEGETEKEGGGWGEGNKPPVNVNFH